MILILLIDILVLASQGEEGLPLCAIEGLSVGKPVIAPSNGGLTDILENESMLVNGVSPEQLAGKMVELLNSTPKRRLFSEMLGDGWIHGCPQACSASGGTNR
jgi:glycosyltransferase involved in cell wall biosynthesis